MNAANWSWRWWKKQKIQKLREVEAGTREAQEAFGDAVDALTRADKLSKEVRPIMRELRDRRQVNHFTELFEREFRGESG